MNTLNKEVTTFLNELNHPFRDEIEQLRIIILSACTELSEIIKWNGPNYCDGDADRITMRIHPPKKQVQLVFHRGATKQNQPPNRLIESDSKLLSWKENDRAIATFKSAEDIESNKAALIEIVQKWIAATSN